MSKRMPGPRSPSRPRTPPFPTKTKKARTKTQTATRPIAIREFLLWIRVAAPKKTISTTKATMPPAGAAKKDGASHQHRTERNHGPFSASQEMSHADDQWDRHQHLHQTRIMVVVDVGSEE